MLRRLGALKGGTIRALDGDIGTIEDFYLDDECWTVRYVVVATGSWLAERHVLLSIISLLSTDWDRTGLLVRLTREQVRRSPDVDTHQPVSRAHEAAILSHYSYPYYWSGPALWGPVPFPAIAADTATTGLLSPPPPAASQHDQRPCEAQTRSSATTFTRATALSVRSGTFSSIRTRGQSSTC